MRTAAHRYPLVDSVRAIAALAVFGTHAAFFAGAEYAGSTIGHFTQRLEVGVAIFFCISGFLLYRPFVAARRAGTRPPATGPYAIRRVLRIVPAYWVALLISSLLLTKPGVLTWDGAWRYFGFAQTYDEITIAGGLTQAWTLCIEAAFYVFLPVWALALRRTGRSLRAEAIALAGLFAASVAYKVAVLWSGSASQIRVTPALIALPAYFDEFALGMGLAVLSVWVAERDEPPRWIRGADWAWAVAAVAFVLVSVGIGIGGALLEPMSRVEYLLRHYLYATIGITVLIPAVLGAGGVVRAVLAHRSLAWLGLISYGIYLWHDTVLALMDKWGFRDVVWPHPYLAWPVVGLALTILVAAVSWYALERPIIGAYRGRSGGGTPRGLRAWARATARSSPVSRPRASQPR